MRLTLARGGGVAGLRRPPHAVEADADLEALARRVLALPPPAPPASPDQLGYTLTIDDGQTHVIDFALASAPPELRELVRRMR